MSRVVHCSVDIENYLLRNKEPIRSLERDGRVLTDAEARAHLCVLIAAGVRVLPLGARCEGFDDVKGCPGHDHGLEEFKASTPPNVGADEHPQSTTTPAAQAASKET